MRRRWRSWAASFFTRLSSPASAPFAREGRGPRLSRIYNAARFGKAFLRPGRYGLAWVPFPSLRSAGDDNGVYGLHASIRCRYRPLAARFKARQMACKPGSVHRLRGSMTIPLGCVSPHTSRDLPGRLSGNGLRAVPIWSCSRWGLPCRSCCQQRGALLPHHFNLAWPVFPKEEQAVSGFISVALSLGSPPPVVIRHRVSVEPGLSSARGLRNATRSSGHLTRA